MGSLIVALGNSSRALWQAVRSAQPRLALVPSGRLARLAQLLALFSRSDEASETLLAEKFFELQIQGDLSEYEARAIDRLRDIMALRALTFGKTGNGKTRLRQGFVTRHQRESVLATDAEAEFAFGTQDVTESATVVAKLYWRLYEICLGSIPELKVVGLQLYFHLFGVPFQSETAKIRITRVTEAIQSDQGVPYLMLNWLRQGAVIEARQLGRHLLMEGVEFEDEQRVSALYWLAEIAWFVQAWSSEKLTHESTLRLLYHLCFTSPDRAGFLEIDSPFFSEFEAVNEMAHEALSYRETLVESLLALWENYEGDFDPLFQKAFETLVGRVSKVVDSRSSWQKAWARSQATFSRDYLFVVEGNLSYLAGRTEDAIEHFEAALAITPDLRPALLNLAFAYARAGRENDLNRLADQITQDRRLATAALYTLGDSYQLVGNEKRADAFYQDLRRIAGWENRVDYYRSTFCLQNGLNAQALKFAQRAHSKVPADTAIAYHLSRCFEAVGDKTQALATLKALEPSTVSSHGWLHYYRFTLERDLGDHTQASNTLMQIPSDYFEDPEEWEAALSFARKSQNIGLMRHLKQKKNPAQ